LLRYRFFFSREQANGRESYWLHFGYFRTAEEARKWREVLVRVYPAAAIHNYAQNGGTPQVLSDTQVFSLLTRKQGDRVAEPAGSRPQRKDTTLEDTLNELRASAWESHDLEDTASTTGVRHLRVEVQATSHSRLPKSPKMARKS
jgi:hypothetical protein